MRTLVLAAAAVFASAPALAQPLVKIDGSSTVFPVTEAVAEDFQKSKRGATRVSPGFSYDSGTNEHFLTVDEIRSLIREHIDPGF